MYWERRFFKVFCMFTKMKEPTYIDVSILIVGLLFIQKRLKYWRSNVFNVADWVDPK